MRARVFDKQGSGFDNATIEFKDVKLYVYLQNKTMIYLVSELEFSQRLGNMPRSIYLSDGKVCECEDNDRIDKELKRLKINKGSSLIHHFESKSVYIIPAILLTVGVVFIFLKFVVPYSAKKISYSLPQSIASKVGVGTLEALDKIILDPTKLPEKRQKDIKHEFLKMTASLKDLPPLNLQFRYAEKIGANAFALPDGTIVMTDQLVLLSHNKKELLAILAHEVGHIKNRHSLRMLFQNSAVFIVIATLTGDATTASSILSALPTMLIESSFSRELEAEADDFALKLMKEKNLDLHYFSDIMKRLNKGVKENETNEYFASHPVTSSRISKFQE